MSTDPGSTQEPDGLPVTEPDDLVLPDDVESTVTAGTTADTLDDAPGDQDDAAPTG